jgi:flagellin-like protein
LYKLFRSKKGISPILATLLLIVIAVAAIIVTYAWVMTYMGAQTSQAGVFITQETLSWYGSPTEAARNRTNIVVKNTGTTTVKITNVYLGSDENNPILVTSACLQGINATIAQGDITTITIAWPNNVGTTWNHAQTYHIWIATNPGTIYHFAYYVQ